MSFLYVLYSTLRKRLSAFLDFSTHNLKLALEQTTAERPKVLEYSCNCTNIYFDSRGTLAHCVIEQAGIKVGETAWKLNTNERQVRRIMERWNKEYTVSKEKRRGRPRREVRNLVRSTKDARRSTLAKIIVNMSTKAG